MASPDKIAIVATGPSVTGVDLSAIDADCIIAVNSAIFLVDPDIWFTLDASHINMQIMHAPRPGVKYFAALPDRHILPDHVRRLTRVSSRRSLISPPGDGPDYWMWRWSAMPGLSEDSNSVHTGNSAYGALGLAYHIRPKEITLYGVDGTREPRATGGMPCRLDHLPMLFESAVPQLEAAGIKVFNASKDSMVTCFERC